MFHSLDRRGGVAFSPIAWHVSYIGKFAEATVFSESFGLVGIAWGPAYGSVESGRFTGSREVDS